jgi:hypothetical protein
MGARMLTRSAPAGRLSPAADLLDLKIAGINSRGQIVGSYYTSTVPSAAFLRSSGGSYTPLEVPGGTSAGPTAIDDGGSIIGTYSNTDLKISEGFLRDPSGTYATFFVHKAATTIPNAIDANGTIVGEYALGVDFTDLHGFYRQGLDSGVVRPSGLGGDLRDRYISTGRYSRILLRCKRRDSRLFAGRPLRRRKSFSMLRESDEL